ncbi:hypothetical protein IFM89_002349 [Coptis chinensis]|uniref:Uncharacterized protein n=1 Tax=Coptis chinensis TaxID=261450 RepID=A0A835M9E1_9MAGN|nr:hypothetical protein IFM89_002349 [Coptis chinensis]
MDCEQALAARVVDQESSVRIWCHKEYEATVCGKRQVKGLLDFSVSRLS